MTGTPGLRREATRQQAWLVATDLDGTLLDHATYSLEPAREALGTLAAHGWPLILASSKTRAELEWLVRTIGRPCPLIVENGGALVVDVREFESPPTGARRDGQAWVWQLGRRRDELVAALAAIAAETGVAIRGFASMTVAEIAARTGLPLDVAALASRRAHDEPFLLEDPTAWPLVAQAAARAGLRVTRGGRFGHLIDATVDKGLALDRLLAIYAAGGRRFRVVALGDAANDAGLLARADRPIVIPRPDGRLDPDLVARVPRAERAPLPGPAGWNAAVLAVLRGDRLPRADGDAA